MRPGWLLRARAWIALVLLAVGCAGDDMGDGEIGRHGFFRLVEDDGVWWFADPDGERMVSLGINHIEPVLISSDSNKHLFAAKYGDDLLRGSLAEINGSRAAARWMNDSMDLVRSWGFNTLGVHNPVLQRQMPYVATFRPVPIDGWAKHTRLYPDPFDPATAARLEIAAKRWCARNADDPLILGVSFNDMPIWRSGPARIHEWVKAIMALRDTAPGKQRWIELLRERYADPMVAAQVYGVTDETWEALAARTAWPAPARPWLAYQDTNRFLPLIADAWYGMEAAAIRSCDANHLVLGDKFEGTFDLPSWLYPIIGRHFDAAYIQWYAHAERQEHKLAELHAATGKPILMGDSAFSHPNDNIKRPKGVHLGSTRAVGKAYATYLKEMMKTPYVVGWHHCGFIEGSPDLARFHPYLAIQPGFLRPDGTPYEDMVFLAKRANMSAKRWHQVSRSGEPRGSWKHRATAGGKRCATNNRKAFSLSQVDNNIFIVGRVAIGTGGVPNKNIGWIVTDEGVVIVDTGFERSAVFSNEVMRHITDKPIKYIIYTHHHGTQVAGAGILKGPDTKIIAHEQLVREFDLAKDMYQYNRRRDSIQFNLPTVADAPPPSPLYPDIAFADRYAFELGGTRFELYHAEGEAEGYSLVFMPDQKVMWVGDMAGAGMPLVGSPMKRARDEVKWRDALTLIERLDPEVMISSVGPPVCAREPIRALLDSRIEYLEFLHDSVAREMNAGSSLEETLANTKLPERIRDNPLLRESYGAHAFNVRALFHRYSGWFDQDGTSLSPAATSDRAAAFVADMGGERKVLARAFELADADEEELALEYADLLIAATDDARAHRLKSDLLFRLARRQTHHMSASMYAKLGALEFQRGNAGPSAEAPPRDQTPPSVELFAGD